MVRLFFVGEDSRIKYLKKLYEKELQIVDSVNMANFVIAPIPFTKDKIHITGEEILIDDFVKQCINKTIFSGGIPKDIRRKMEMNNVQYYDLIDLDEIAYLNAIPTAEGAIAKAMELTDYTIHGANILVLGFGRLGKILLDKLKGLKANVFCEARSKKDLAHIEALGYNVVELNNLDDHLEKFDIIFSTVPTMILGEKRLNLLNKNTVIIDLASAPGSIDYNVARKLGINAVLELGIPSKVAPKSAAIYLKKSIDDIIYNS